VLREVQNLRAFAVLAVILIHVTASFTKVGHLTYVTGIALALDSAAQVAVPLFVCISGFVLLLKNYSLSTFYFKRSLAILPAYLFFSVFYAMYFHKPILNSILDGKAAHNLYFFTVIFGLYILFPLIKRLYFGEITLITSLLMQLYFWNLPYVSYLKTMPIWFYSWIGYIFYFVLGIYVCKNYAKIQKILENIPTIYIVSPTIILWILRILYWLNSYYKIEYYGRDLLQIVWINKLITIALFTGIFATAYKLVQHDRSQILKKIGDYSFGIYLVHVLMLDKIFQMLSRQNIEPTEPVFYIISFIITVIMSYAIIDIWHRIRERLGRRSLKQII
jgi:surface polysaccharide O-acyltransferase-like enzyme